MRNRVCKRIMGLEQMCGTNEMLEFFKSRHKSELTFAKLRVIHAYDAYDKGLVEVWDKRTKGMTKSEKEEFKELLSNGMEDGQLRVMSESLVKKVSDDYNVDIDQDEFFFEIVKYIKYFRLAYRGEGKKDLSRSDDENFDIELTDEAYFLIDLINKLIIDNGEKK